MFTGIIRELGLVNRVVKKSGTTAVEIESTILISELEPGASIAVNGVCLTVTGKRTQSFTVDIVEETIKRTTFSRLKTGDRVNLEPALGVRDKFEGHIVQGHVDGTGTIRNKEVKRDSILLTIELPRTMESNIVEKGSASFSNIISHFLFCCFKYKCADKAVNYFLRLL